MSVDISPNTVERAAWILKDHGFRGSADMLSALRSALTCCEEERRLGQEETRKLRAELSRLHCPDDAACRDETVRRLQAEIAALYARHQRGEVLCRSCDLLTVELAEARAEVERLQEDAERGAYVVAHGGWIRDERNDCAYLTIRLPLNADLSCVAMRRAAIDAARKEGA